MALFFPVAHSLVISRTAPTGSRWRFDRLVYDFCHSVIGWERPTKNGTPVIENGGNRAGADSEPLFFGARDFHEGDVKA
jgi:hypothetical protein